MAEDVNLYESMSRFFGSLSHDLAAGEQVELLWQPRYENKFLRREYFPDLERATRRASSLGPAHDVYLQATTEPGKTPWETESTQLLAYCYHRPRRSDESCGAASADVAEMRPLPYAEPSLEFLYRYPDGNFICEAGWFYYRSRCPMRRRSAAAGHSLEREW